MWCHALPVYKRTGFDGLPILTGRYKSLGICHLRCYHTVKRRLLYLGTFSRRLYILTCRYRYTIHGYWSSSHWCHIQEKKHRIRQCLEQQTYWLMKKKKKNWRALTQALTCDARSTHFPLKFICLSPCLISWNLSVAVASKFCFSFSAGLGAL